MTDEAGIEPGVGAGAHNVTPVTAVRRPPTMLWMLVGVIALAGLGWIVVKTVDALRADAGCGSYGYGGYQSYGGYGCGPDRGDAGLTVEPSTGLVDRQTVTVRGTRFDPNTQFGAAQCDAALVAELQSSVGCDLSNSVISRTAPDGSVVVSMTVRRVIVAGGVEVDCAVRACVIGAATIPDGWTPLESASAPIHFDPTVPAVPRLTIGVAVDRVTRYAVYGTVVCNRAAEAYVSAFVRQARGSREAIASGEGGNVPCAPTPVAWVAPLRQQTGRVGGGTVSYDISAYAFDNTESASAALSGETRVAPGGPPAIEPVERPGDTVMVSIEGAAGRGNEQTIDLVVACDRAVPQGYASVVVNQWAGSAQIQGYGNTEFGPCIGTTRVSVPIRAVTGTLVGATAAVTASVFITDPGSVPPFSDSASAVDAVRLSGRTAPDDVVEPNPNSRITITRVGRSSVSGTVECAEPVDVVLYVNARQRRGRESESSFGETTLQSCSGASSFTINLGDDLRLGEATVTVYGQAFRVVDGPFYEFVWNDQQSARARVRN